MGGKKWSAEEDRALIWYWECRRETLLAHLPGRSWPAIRWRARVIHGLWAKDQGRGLSLNEMARRLGYNSSVIFIIACRLGLSKTKGGVWSDGSYDLIKTELERLGFPNNPNKRPASEWGVYKPDRCLCCQRSDVPHYARGICYRCYYLARSAGKLPPKISCRRPYPLTEWSLESEDETDQSV